MNVTHINTYCTGGAAKACLRTVKALRNAGANSNMLVLYKTNTEKLITDVRDEWPLMKNYELKIRNKIYNWKQKWKYGNKEELFSSYHTVWDISQHNLVQSADVVNLHWTSGFVDFPSFFNSVNKKIIFTLHDYYPFSGGYHYPNPYFETGEFKKLTDKNRAFLKALYKANDISFVGPSQYIIDQFNNLFGQNEFKTTVIRNPVDPEIFFYMGPTELRQKHGIREQEKVLLFVNEHELYKRKGFQFIKKIIPGLLGKGYKIILAGAESNAVPPDVIQTGYLKSDEELNAYYNLADLVLFPSLDDNLPNVISESLCSGTPVVAFNSGGIPEMINHGKNGFLVEKGDLSGFEAQIHEALKILWDKKNISENSQLVYSESIAAKQYMTVYAND